jgi:flagellar basal-body rod modification protein FlgD
MQDSIGTLSESMRSAQVLDGSTMIGRDVLVPSEDASLGSSGAIRGAVEIPTGAVSAQMNIRNSAGALVRSMPVTANAGLQDFTWDGITSAGERAESGAYSFEVVANVGGENESLETLLADRVNSVTIDATKGLTLNTTALGPRALSDVRRVM